MTTVPAPTISGSTRYLIDVPGAQLAVDEVGAGDPIVVVHGEDGDVFLAPFIERLASEHLVRLVHLPGWGVSELPAHARSVADLAHALLGLLDTESRPVPVVGLSFGAWVVAEAAAWCDRSMSSLTLVSPLGLRSGSPTDRSFVDLFATDPADVRSALYADPQRAPDLAGLDDDDYLRLAQAQEAVARFGWAPYLNDPQLGPRLGRVTVPTLVVVGSDDRFVLEPDYPAPWLEFLGGPSHSVVIPGVGHRPEEEAPGDLVARIVDHVASAAQPSGQGVAR